MMRLELMASPTDYADSPPFPHAVIDGAFDAAILDRVAREIAAIEVPREKNYYGAFEKRRLSQLADMPPTTRTLIDYFNGPQFIGALETMTGIAGLIPDETLEGAGVHQIGPGGYLRMHADFNWHRHLKLYRRINVLVYLNDGWRDEWEGALELWERDMSACRIRVAPLMNRMVVFSTSDDSFHGHPEILACPSDVRRNSIALYYYTQSHPGVRISTLTDWRERPGERFGLAAHKLNRAMLRHPLLGKLLNEKTAKPPSG